MQRLKFPPCAASGVCLLAPFLLVGCAEPPGGYSPITDALNQVSFDPPPATGTVAPVVPGAAPGARGAGQPQIFYGTARPVAGAAAGPGPIQARRTSDGVAVNFDRAEVREVARVILGEILRVPYSVDPRITGEITLTTSGPLPERDLLGAFETVLTSIGAALVEEAGTFVVVPADQLRGTAQIVPLGGGMTVRPGLGLTVVPLRYVSATVAAQFVQPMLHRAEDIRVDATRNLILFSGTSAERQAVVDTLAELDVDWLAGRSVGIFPLSVATPEAVIPELEALFGAPEGPEASPALVRFLPMARLNAVLAIANSPQQIREIQQWVTRLDRGHTVGVQFFVHQLRHAPAEDIARVLNESFADLAAPGAEGGVGPLGTPGMVPPAVPPAAVPGVPGGGPPTELQSPVPFGAGPASDLFAGGTPASVLGPVKVVPNKINNSLLIRATPEAYEMIEATLRRLDTPPLQVLIQATIAEVTLNDTLRYGVQYFFETNGFRFGFNNTVPSAGGIVRPDQLGPLARVPGFNFIYSGGDANITIDALSQFTDVKVLSSPSVVVQDNSEAVLTVGDEVPIITRTAQSVDNPDAPVVANIEYRDTGVILEVRPRVNTEQVVALEIAQEVSRVSEQVIATQATTLSPTFTQRKITSRVNVTSGQTVVLGGLIQDSETRGRDQIPVLGEIPVVGNLFGSTSNVSRRTELIVFITPRVIRDANDARDVSEELRSRLRSLRPTTPYAPGEPVPIPGANPMPAPLPPPRSPVPLAALPAPPPPAASEAPLPEPAAVPPPVEPLAEEPLLPPGPPEPAPAPALAQVRFDLARAPLPVARPGPPPPRPPAARPPLAEPAPWTVAAVGLSLPPGPDAPP